MRCSPSHACYKEDIQPDENHPAILSQTETLTLFVLADLGGGEVEPIYGLRRFRVKALLGHFQTGTYRGVDKCNPGNGMEPAGSVYGCLPRFRGWGDY